MDDAPGRREDDRRGVSSPIAIVLILGIVVVGSSVALVGAATVIGDSQRQLDANRAEKTLSQLDSQVSLVGLGNARTQRTALSSVQDEAYDLRPDSGWMNVTITNVTDDSTRTMFNATMGAVVYENDDRSVAYQGGGVWRGDRDGAFMVSPPEFHYRDATLTLPLVTVNGDRSLSGTVNIQRNGSTAQHFPNTTRDTDWQNPLDNGLVNVTVHSEYYRAWGSFWEQRTDGDVSYDHDDRRASVDLVVPAGQRTVSSAIASTSATGELEMSGTNSDPTRTDSYNSSQGDYDSSKSANGTIVTAGDVTLTGTSGVNGTLESGGFVDISNPTPEVQGDVFHTDGATIHHGATIDGDVEQISGVEGADPIDGYVARRYDGLDDDNDNGPEGSISGDSLEGGDQTLGPGRYHLDEISLNNEELTLDTGSGELIEIGVRDHIRLVDDSAIEVQGTGQVRFYVDGQSTGPDGFNFNIANAGSSASEVDVATAENASQFWIYGNQDFQARVDGSGTHDYRYEGVIYAPGGPSGSSSFEIDKAELFGSVAVGDVTMGNGGNVHFDQALENERAVPEDESIVRLTYMHVTHSRVNVTG